MENTLSRIVYKGKRIEEPEIVINDMIDISVEGITNDRVKYFVKDFEKILLSYEVISQTLELDNEPIRKAAYDYGRMYSIAVLLSKIAEEQKERENLDEIKYKSKYLKKALATIDEKGNISGRELAAALGMKNRSDLTNFMNRVERYKLFRCVKVGNKNYYSLSVNGKKYIEYLKATDNYSVKADNIGFFHCLLENLAEELKKSKPKAFSVIIKTNNDIPNNSMFTSKVLKRGIENVINARDVRFNENFIDKSDDFTYCKYKIKHVGACLSMQNDTYR
ncbi:MAG: hypothetical protein IJA01_06455 [Firmicutes bacterium]|nr:hypothetical protein [Bacillota bacterium]